MFFAAACLILSADPTPVRREWAVEKVAREALVVTPAKKTPHPPLVFVFHGHGGTMKQTADTYNIAKFWPEAVVVYPQGVNTPGRLSDPQGKKPGWQAAAGDHGDRDLKFFDAMRDGLQADHAIDPKRVYVTGHSNGGAFAFLLWVHRPDALAGIAPSAAGERDLRGLKPIPCLHVAGEKDDVVKFEYQKAVMANVRKMLGCDATGKSAGLYCTEYASKTGTPFVAFVHPGGHTFPPEAVERIAKFFQRHAKK